MKFIIRAMILIVFICTHISQPMATDFQSLSKLSDDQLKKEIFPTDYDQEKTYKKIGIISSDLKQAKENQDEPLIARTRLSRSTQKKEYVELGYKYDVIQRMIRIYQEELDKLKRKQIEEDEAFREAIGGTTY